MDIPLPDVHLLGYPLLDLLGPSDTQHHHEDNVGEEKGPLVDPTPAKETLPFCSQYGREAAPYCARGRQRAWCTIYLTVRVDDANNADR